MTAASIEIAYAEHKAGRLDAAVAGYRAVLAEDPKNADALNLLAVARRAQGAVGEAVGLLARAVTVNPTFADAWFNYGNALSAAGDHVGAANAYRRVTALDPRRAAGHANLGVALGESGDAAGAAQAYERALALEPGHLIARHNLGNVYPDLGRYHDGIRELRRVAADHPDLAEARYNLALSLLRLGDFASGLRLYESRWQAPGFQGKRYYRDLPDWDGTPFRGRRLVVHAEQGLGDTIQYARFLSLVRSLGGEVTLQVQSSLVKLFGTLKGPSRVVGEGAEIPGQDMVLPMMSLPYRLGLTLGSIPAQAPYLAAEPARVTHWRNRLSPATGDRLIGVVWRGNPKAPVDRGRSMPGPMLLQPLAALPGVRLVALNPLEIAETLEIDGRTRVAACPAIEYPGPGFDEGPDGFLDTAAAMMLCDMVVTTDTSIVHLAGALARPTILMLKANADWRWMTDRADTPWYPTVRLVRQKRAGDWKAVVSEVANQLAVEFALA